MEYHTHSSESQRPGRFGDRIPVWVRFPRTRPDRTWVPLHFLRNGYLVISGVKVGGARRWTPKLI
jgi:hypothetical protein